LVDRLLTYLGAGTGRKTFAAGEPVTLPLPDALRGDGVTVRAPGGAELTPRLRAIGGNTLLHLDEAPEPGVYRVRRPAAGSEMTFVANVGQGDCTMSPMPAATLAQWWEPASFEMIRPDVLPGGTGSVETPFALWPALVVLACLLLLLEMFFVHRACPAAIPAVVAPVVTRRGLAALTQPRSPP
jgi:hypothetical protein